MICREALTLSSSSWHSSAQRPSFHKMAGRNTCNDLSSRVAPCICPAMPSAFTSRRLCCAPRAFIAVSVASHHCSGSCSDHSGCGRETVSFSVCDATTSPCSLSRMALTPDVPRSMPIYILPLLKRAPRLSVARTEHPGCGAGHAGRRRMITCQTDNG